MFMSVPGHICLGHVRPVGSNPGGSIKAKKVLFLNIFSSVWIVSLPHNQLCLLRSLVTFSFSSETCDSRWCFCFYPDSQSRAKGLSSSSILLCFCFLNHVAFSVFFCIWYVLCLLCCESPPSAFPLLFLGEFMEKMVRLMKMKESILWGMIQPIGAFVIWSSL